MTADESIKLWASKRIGVPVEKIDKVDFVHEDAYRYSEYTEELAYDAAQVTFTEYIPYPGFPQQIKSYDISIDGTDFGALLREILEVAS